MVQNINKQIYFNMVTESNVTATDLEMVPLPNHPLPYIAVSHKSIIDETLAKLEEKGFKIQDEYYLKNLSGSVASGIYHLEHGDDEDIKLLFSWRNSYDKSKRFSCAIGAHVILTGGRMISGEISNFIRKHTGEVNELVKTHIDTQITSAISYYNGLVNDKNIMKSVELNDSELCEFVGTLYMKGILSKTQISSFKEEYDSKVTTLDVGKSNLWSIYNDAILALRVANPSSWVEQHKDLHKLTKAMFFSKSTIPTVDPAQVDLLDSIEEITEGAIEEPVGQVSIGGAIIPEPEAIVQEIKPINMSLGDYLEEVTPEEKVEPEVEEAPVFNLSLENYDEEIENVEPIAPIEIEPNVTAKPVIIDEGPIDITGLSKEEVADLIKESSNKVVDDKSDETVDESPGLSHEITPDVNEQIDAIVHPDIVEEAIDIVNEESAQQVLHESVSIQEEIDSDAVHLDGDISELQSSTKSNPEQLFSDVIDDTEDDEQDDIEESPMLF